MLAAINIPPWMVLAGFLFLLELGLALDDARIRRRRRRERNALRAERAAKRENELW